MGGKTLLVLLLCCITFNTVLPGCTTSISAPQIDVSEEWLRFPPLRFFRTNEQELEFLLLPERYMVEYIDKLASKPFVILSVDEYKGITGEIPERKYAIAVRALYNTLGGGYHVVRGKYNTIGILYSGMGNREYMQQHKSVLLLEVDKLPRVVYVVHTLVE